MIVAASIGNAFEWYDFIVFGYFALAISKQFFPDQDPTSALLSSLAAFGVAFVMRPLGAVVLGHYADRYGRKPALILAICLMMAGTLSIAISPTPRSAGSIAPLFIIVGRLLQGFSAGGEFGSATAFLAEQDPRRRGFYGSWQFASQAVALVLATSCGVVLSRTLNTEMLEAWGWRIPFALGILIGPVALYIRARIPETSEFQSTKVLRSPTRNLFASFKFRALTAIGLVTVATVTVYTLVFMPTFAVRYLGYSSDHAFTASLCTGMTQVILIPIGGAWSDKWGRLPVAGGATVVMMLTAIPLLTWLVSAPTFVNLILFQIWVGAVLALYLGVLPAMIAELFPTQVRTSGLSISYSLAVAFFGGFAPLINASLIEVSGSEVAPSYYLTAAAIVSLVALFSAHRFGIE